MAAAVDAADDALPPAAATAAAVLALIVAINNAGSSSNGEVLFANIAIAVLRQYWRRLLSLRMLIGLMKYPLSLDNPVDCC